MRYRFCPLPEIHHVGSLYFDIFSVLDLINRESDADGIAFFIKFDFSERGFDIFGAEGLDNGNGMSQAKG